MNIQAASFSSFPSPNPYDLLNYDDGLLMPTNDSPVADLPLIDLTSRIPPTPPTSPTDSTRIPLDEDPLYLLNNSLDDETYGEASISGRSSPYIAGGSSDEPVPTDTNPNTNRKRQKTSYGDDVTSNRRKKGDLHYLIDRFSYNPLLTRRQRRLSSVYNTNHNPTRDFKLNPMMARHLEFTSGRSSQFYKGYWRNGQVYQIGDWVALSRSADGEPPTYGIIKYFFLCQDEEREEREERDDDMTFGNHIPSGEEPGRRSRKGVKTVRIDSLQTLDLSEDNSERWKDFCVVFMEITPIDRLPPFTTRSFMVIVRRIGSLEPSKHATLRGTVCMSPTAKGSCLSQSLYQKDQLLTPPFGEKEAKEITMRTIPELVRMVDAYRRPELSSDSEGRTAYFNISPGLYVKMSVERTEPALSDQVIKSDHWEGNHILRDAPVLEGAPNFRRIPGTIMFGVGQPTAHGLTQIISTLSSERHSDYSSFTPANDISNVDDDHKEPAKHVPAHQTTAKVETPSDNDRGPFDRILWINLREEPCLYIGEDPYAPRDPQTLNVNLDHLAGIEGNDLEKMEQILKADVIAKARSNEFKIPVVRQANDMNNAVDTVTYSPGTIWTPKEVFSHRSHALPLRYERIPITDECAPQERDLEQMVFLLKDVRLLASSHLARARTAVVFNCQMGRGRTTTGLVCAYLIMYVHIVNDGFSQRAEAEEFYKQQPERSNASSDYLKGEYSVIMKLVDSLPNGLYVKHQVDKVIDACSQVQNLREAIFECRERWLQAKEGDEATKYLDKGMRYLERYWWIIVFNGYLMEQSPKGFEKTFTQWMGARWDFKKLLKKRMSLD
ncbi:hypothetical protein PROFUN_12399 [Planoprotostelium fungivorum]|uniref:Paladin-like n=1 Tax=Planoprotostelium fungivorum TaxID=1890364 RepID=A0A2P6N7J4_9EUKA|nr:hypothetical protein PROFUN_12399 [Planoprotostelium fungivorum]